jgi:choloylglycine hydrolase
MKKRLFFAISLFVLVLMAVSPPISPAQSVQMDESLMSFQASQACSSFCLDNGDHCVFGANQDNTIEAGLLIVNKRGVLKTGWEPGTTGEYARWVSRYGSVTFDFAGYQIAWAGMNEAGLMVSTMALGETRNPAPDARPPLTSGLWLQYQLDNYSTVEQVIAGDARVRISDTVDHYLTCDRQGDCATIEFLGGRLVYYTGKDLLVKALTNSVYEQALRAWQAGNPSNNSFQRFATAADRVKSFKPTSAEAAVNYAFDTLAKVALEINVWRIVFDPANLRVYFRTNRNPQIRSVDFRKLDFSCRTSAMMLDVQANGSGDISNQFVAYSHEAGLNHTLHFFEQYKRLSYPPLVLDVLLRGLESFACVEGDASTQADLMPYRPLLPPTVAWVGLTLFYRLWPILLLIVLLLAFVTLRMKRSSQRLIVGLVLIAIAVPIFLFGGENYSTAGAVAFGVLGLVSIATSRKNKTV